MPGNDMIVERNFHEDPTLTSRLVISKSSCEDSDHQWMIMNNDQAGGFLTNRREKVKTIS